MSKFVCKKCKKDYDEPIIKNKKAYFMEKYDIRIQQQKDILIVGCKHCESKEYELKIESEEEAKIIKILMTDIFT